MNKQKKTNKDGSISRGIEWTDYTWNPIGGCKHACQWTMPDGAVANCYAEDVAHGVARAAYPQGFEHHYWNPKVLQQPLNVKTPSKVFVGSMADVFGHWVPEEHILAVLDICRKAHWHTFQFLTKNPRRALQLASHIPANCWIGASTPPDFMWGKALNALSRQSMLLTTLKTLAEIRSEHNRMTWISAEPITIDVGGHIWDFMDETTNVPPIDWMVIGAASNGKTVYKPDLRLVKQAVWTNDMHGIATFYKGNLMALEWAAANWREEFPTREVER